ncbi:type I-E CRISPR-associated protein Cse1/CasA [Streptomyces goshikiensis]|uniref:type I-E CRISPR-associated protein Cse1/CasA n=1 Tax=Streptomyces goshikiensis TaxID=1942 RepID=UPI00369201CB
MSFPLTTGAWIPVYDHDSRTFREVGLNEALLAAHRLEFTGRGQEGAVLLRVLLAAFDAAAGPVTYEEWVAAWQAETLDAARITAYLEQWEHRLDLLHPQHPAFQCGALTDFPRDARVLHPSYLGGAGGRMLSEAFRAEEGRFPAWEPGQAARALLVLIGYDVAGIKRAAPGDRTARAGKVYGSHTGAVAQVSHVNIVGRTVKDTILLNLPPQPRRRGDAPVWERTAPAAPMAVRQPVGRLDVLTWPGRRIRLRTDSEGRVDRVARHDGDRMPDPWRQLAEFDPLSLWREGREGGLVPAAITDSHGVLVPWAAARSVLDPDGEEGGTPGYSGVGRHLARILDEGWMADYGPVRVEASATLHTTPHKSVISDVSAELVALGTGGFLTARADRSDLAAAARTADVYLARLRAIVKEVAPAHHPRMADRIDFMPLHGRWEKAAGVLASDPVQGRRLWRADLGAHARQVLEMLPLRLDERARAEVLAEEALPIAEFTGNVTPSHDRLRHLVSPPRRPRTKAPRTGRPTLRALTAYGETKSLAQWAKDPRCQVSYPTLRARAAAMENGQDAESILTTPASRSRRPALPEPAAVIPAPRAALCKGCGMPVTGAISRCEECRAKRVTADWLYRKEIAEVIFSPAKRAELLRRLAGGEALADACIELDLTPHRAHGFAAYDDDWRGQLDDALTVGRDPDLDHGTERAYRYGGCRCPECRTAHDAVSATSR